MSVVCWRPLGTGAIRGIGGVRGPLGHWQGVYVLRDQQGYRWHHGAPRGVQGVRGHWGLSGGVGTVRVVFGAGRE